MWRRSNPQKKWKSGDSILTAIHDSEDDWHQRLGIQLKLKSNNTRFHIKK